jgi:hypothetical protein
VAVDGVVLDADRIFINVGGRGDTVKRGKHQ